MVTRGTELKIIACLFGSVIIIYLVGFVLLQAAVYSTQNSIRPYFPVSGSDSTEYAALGKNILKNQQFSLSAETPFKSETFRTPGYPLFVAATFTFTNSFIGVVIAQIIVITATSVVVFYLARSIMPFYLALLPAVLFALDPAIIFNTLIILSDSLYVGVLLLALLIILKSNSTFRGILLAVIASSCLLGFSVLVRPISMYLPIIFIPFIIFYFKNKLSVKRVLSLVGMFILCYSLILGPWLYRNYVKTGVVGISSVSAYNLVYYNVPWFLSEKNGQSITEISSSLLHEANVRESDVRNLESGPKMLAVAKKYLRANAANYLVFHLKGLLPFFFGSGLKTVVTYLDALGFLAFGQSLLSFSFLYLLFNVERVFWLVVFLGMLLGLYTGRRNKLVVVMALLVWYFALLTGPVAYSRYRMPAAPFMYILATYGFYQLYVLYLLRFKKRIL